MPIRDPRGSGRAIAQAGYGVQLAIRVVDRRGCPVPAAGNELVGQREVQYVRRGAGGANAPPARHATEIGTLAKTPQAWHHGRWSGAVVWTAPHKPYLDSSFLRKR